MRKRDTRPSRPSSLLSPLLSLYKSSCQEEWGKVRRSVGRGRVRRLRSPRPGALAGGAHRPSRVPRSTRKRASKRAARSSRCNTKRWGGLNETRGSSTGTGVLKTERGRACGAPPASNRPGRADAARRGSLPFSLFSRTLQTLQGNAQSLDYGPRSDGRVSAHNNYAAANDVAVLLARRLLHARRVRESAVRSYARVFIDDAVLNG